MQDPSKYALPSKCQICYEDKIETKKVTDIKADGSFLSVSVYFGISRARIQKCDKREGRSNTNHELVAKAGEKVLFFVWNHEIVIKNEKGHVYVREANGILSSIDICTPKTLMLNAYNGKVEEVGIKGIEFGIRPDRKTLFILWFKNASDIERTNTADMIREDVPLQLPESTTITTEEQQPLPPPGPIKSIEPVSYNNYNNGYGYNNYNNNYNNYNPNYGGEWELQMLPLEYRVLSGAFFVIDKSDDFFDSYSEQPQQQANNSVYDQQALITETALNNNNNNYNLGEQQVPPEFNQRAAPPQDFCDNGSSQCGGCVGQFISQRETTSVFSQENNLRDPLDRFTSDNYPSNMGAENCDDDNNDQIGNIF